MVVSVQEHLTSPELEVSDATNFQEDTDRDPPDVIYVMRPGSGEDPKLQSTPKNASYRGGRAAD